MPDKNTYGVTLRRLIRISIGRISRKEVLTYLFFVLLAAVFWVGVTMHDQDVAIDKLLEQMSEMQFKK